MQLLPHWLAAIKWARSLERPEKAEHTPAEKVVGARKDEGLGMALTGPPQQSPRPALAGCYEDPLPPAAVP